MKYFVTSSEYILHIDIFIFSAKLIDWLRFILVSHLIIYVIWHYIITEYSQRIDFIYYLLLISTKFAIYTWNRWISSRIL